jgi:transcriptional regulator with GAF, ATPase, and Fis domain
VLDRREVSRLGEPGMVRSVDVRIVAATNRDLHDEVGEGRFRSDLFHRLSQETLTLPPLRQRDSDAIELAELMVDRIAEKHQFELELGKDARAALALYDWPGNVRELHNVIRRAALLRRSGTIQAVDLRFGPSGNTATRLGEVLTTPRDYESSHLEFDRVLIPAVLREVDGNLSAAAARLEISRDRLRRRLIALGLYGDGDTEG